jgi:hypothetical protein
MVAKNAPIAIHFMCIAPVIRHQLASRHLSMYVLRAYSHTGTPIALILAILSATRSATSCVMLASPSAGIRATWKTGLSPGCFMRSFRYGSCVIGICKGWSAGVKRKPLYSMLFTICVMFGSEERIWAYAPI